MNSLVLPEDPILASCFDEHERYAAAGAISLMEREWSVVPDDRHDSPETLVRLAAQVLRFDLPCSLAEVIIQSHYNLVGGPEAGPPAWTTAEIHEAVARSAQKQLEEDTASGVLRSTYGEWLDANAALPPLDYLVDGLFVKNDVLMVAAYGGSLKTWDAMSLMLAVQTGKPWLGVHRVSQGNVMLLDYETGEYEVRRRLKLLAKGEEVPTIRYRWQGGSLHDPKTWEQIEHELLRFKIRLLVIDSLAGGSGVENENESTFALPLKYAGQVAEDCGCTVVFIHHERKGDGSGAEKIRGSSAIHGAVDAAWRCSQVKEDGEFKRTTFGPTKPGAGPTPKEIRLKLSDRGGLQLDVDAPAAGDADEQARREILDLVRRMAGSGGATARDIRGQISGRHGTVDAMRKTLEAEGLIVKI